MRGRRLSTGRCLALCCLLVPLGLLFTAGCADLSAIEPGCGNRAVERGEHCDGDVPGFACRGADEPHACRWDCADTPCPDGLSCGNDDVCRAPSGTFTATQALEATTVRLGVADVDGDGREDLIQSGVGEVATHYFDADAELESVTRVSLFTFEHTHADLNGDGIAELAAVRDPTSVSVFIGRDGRTVTPHPFTTLTLPAAAEGGDMIFSVPSDSPAHDDDVILVSAAGIFGIVDIGGQSAAPIYAGELAPLSSLAGVAHADVDKVLLGCGDLATAVGGDDAVLVHTLCRLFSPNIVGDGHIAHRTITLSDGATVRTPKTAGQAGAMPPHVDSGVHFTHVPGLDDDRLDLLVAVDKGGAPRWEVGYGVGNGTFHSDPAGVAILAALGLSGDNRTAPISLPATDCEGDTIDLGRSPEFPLLIEDFNGDGVVDFILASAFQLSLHGLGLQIWQPSCIDPDDETSALTSLDFNSDGRPDLAVAIDDIPAVFLYLNTPTGLVVHFLAVTGDVRGLAATDVDGDAHDDLIVLVPAPAPIDPDEPQEDRLLISFGAPSAGPAPFQEVARFAGVERIFTGRFLGDSIGDVAVVREGGAERKGAILFGDTGRTLQAPFFLFPPDGYANRPMSLSVGHFRGEGAPAEIAIASLCFNPDKDPEAEDTHVDSDFRSCAWTVDLGDPPAATDAETGPVGEDFFIASDLPITRMATIDLDPTDGHDEVVTVFGPRLQWLGVEDVGDPASALVVHGEVALPVGLGEATTIEAYARFINVADVDGDGFDDVIVAGLGELAILWNDPGDDGRTLTLTALELSCDDDEHATAIAMALSSSVAPLQIDGDPAHELALATTAGILVADFSGRELLRACPIDIAPIGANEIAAGDFDGDGIDDLATGSELGLQIFKGVAAP